MQVVETIVRPPYELCVPIGYKVKYYYYYCYYYYYYYYYY